MNSINSTLEFVDNYIRAKASCNHITLPAFILGHTCEQNRDVIFIHYVDNENTSSYIPLELGFIVEDINKVYGINFPAIYDFFVIFSQLPDTKTTASSENQ